MVLGSWTIKKVILLVLDSLWSSVVGYLSLEFARVQRTYVTFFALVDSFPREGENRDWRSQSTVTVAKYNVVF